MLIDSSFQILYGKRDTGNEKGIIVVNNNRKLRIKARDHFEWRAWLKAFDKAMRKSEWGPYSERKFGSFAPQRKKNYVKHFIDGKDYFSTLHAELAKAEREVFITDWWLTPELYLKRPVSFEIEGDMDKYRLDQTLLELAEKNVKIFILVWKEVEVAGLYNASTHVKSTLMKLHKNIKVIRHPRTIISMWSHHEKIVVIDQNIAFLGGLDICMGRWDTNEHLLSDPKDKNGKCYFPGLDYSNSRSCDFTNVVKYRNESINRNSQPRMPWHDVAVVIYGESAQDCARHFIEYWNHAKIDYEGTKNKKAGTFLKPIRGETLSNMILERVSDDSESDEFSRAETQGILGKSMVPITEEDELEESEGSQYSLRNTKNNIDATLRKLKLATSNNSINEEKENEDKEDEDDDQEDHKDNKTSSDNSSDYFDDEEEEESKLSNTDAPDVIKGKYMIDNPCR
jgi:phospholipase D1/2